MEDKPVLEKVFNEDLNIEELIKEGGILARLYIEVQGNDREISKEALNTTVFERLSNEPNVSLLEVKLYDLKKEDDKDEFYTGVVEIKLIAHDFRWLVNTVMRYGPTAIEIIEPEEVHLSSDQMHSIVADVSSTSQMLSSQLLSLLKDDERRAIYEKILEKKDF